MGQWLRTLSTKIKTTVMVAILLTAQVAGAVLPFMPSNAAHATPAPQCINDTAGANDVPGQKDLTRLCVDYAGLPTTVSTTWNWDELGTTGANTLDACNLFDTDGDGNANYAVCVTTAGTPASFQTLTTYSCGDASVDRCTSPNTPIPSTGTTCTVAPSNTDPFPTGANSPTDTQGSCTVALSTVGGSAATLIDVCSYPSSQPNSDPSDCVIAVPGRAKLTVIKSLVPATDTGRFDLKIDGTTYATNVGDGGTTGTQIVTAANNNATHTVAEVANSTTNSTSLSNYSTALVCKDQHGTGTTLTASSPTDATNRQDNVTVAADSDVVCTFTNTASASITIVKDAIPNSTQDFTFTTASTGVSGFTLDDDNGVVGADNTNSNTKTFNGLAAGSYSFTEGTVSGWDFDNIACNATVQKSDKTVTITLSAGQNVTCTYTNRQRGHIVVNKVTSPANDTTSFLIAATSSTGGNITGGGSASVATNAPVTYDVSQGTYAIAETVPSGWSLASNTCANLVINGNTPLVNGVPTVSCTITNTKLAKLKIVKAALPFSTQSFSYTTTGTGLSPFSLVDDSANTTTNQQQFVDLAPGAYSVTEQSATGWSLTGLSCDTNNYTVATSTVNVNLAAGQNTTCTYTNTKLGSLSGTKYEVNADGSQVGVTGLSNWTIHLMLNGVDTGQTAVTDANGNYTFNGLLPGNYSTFESLLNGWTQIYGSNAVSLSAGQNSAGSNFGNFKNASISGFKFNDLNGSASPDQGEPHLSGWTINLYKSPAVTPTASTSTDGSGNYSFTNLAPGDYSVCEVQQNGWVQTYPAANACNSVTVALSGHDYTNTNFGNQGRGTITVVKNVDDGFGNVTSDVTNWNWNIDGSGNFATGSADNQAVAAGTYTVAEVQKAGYHVTASSCTNETVPNNPTTSLSATVSPGEAVVCTFTNTRDTGNLTINKVLIPANDTGLFNLQVDGSTAGTGANVGNGGSTGSVMVTTGTHSVSETAGTNTNLSNYNSSYSCTNNLSGSGTTTGNFSVAFGESVTCTFTNVRYAHISIAKQTLPDGSSQSFNFSASYNLLGFNLTDGQTNNSGNLLPDTYSVSESSTDGWDFTSLVCDTNNYTPNGAMVSINLAAGQTTNCTFTNTQRGSVHGTKTIVNSNGTTASSQTGRDGITINLYQGSSASGSPFATTTTASDGSYSFTNLVPGDYFVEEMTPAGYTEISGGGTFTLSPGENETSNSTVNFGNFKNATISGYKFNDLNGDGALNASESKLSGWEITLSQDGTQVGDTTTDGNGNYSFTNLVPGTYTVCEVAQDGWVQTTAPTCYEITINVSGESDQAVFGNRGFGTITVIKNVDDGFGNVTSDASNWTWNYDGTYLSDEGVTVGSANQVTVPAGNYTITENQQANYHFTSLVCGEDSQEGSTTQVTVEANSNIVCTYTNTRDTGTIKVTKSLAPATDTGLFNLFVDATADATDVGDGGTTGDVRVLTGDHSVSEVAGTGTNLSDYISSYVCSNGDEETVLSGSGTTTLNFSVSANETVDCVFTNVRKATLTVVKHVFPINSAQSFNFTLSRVDAPVVEEDSIVPAETLALNQLGGSTLSFVKNFTLDDNTDPTLPNSDISSLSPGIYEVSEAATSGWDLASMDCGDVTVTRNGTAIRFTLSAGQQLTCTFINQKHVTPQVLGALTNTGLPLLAYTLTALTLLATAVYVVRYRKPGQM